jgi:ketosteroid isomerase-like protein
MGRIYSRGILVLAILLICFGTTTPAQKIRERLTESGCNQSSPLNGVYRIDADSSDKLYSVIEGASSNVPFADQQQFFIDLAVRLTPPDLLAIECHGRRVSLGSSRSPRVNFTADGVTRSVNNSNGQIVRSRISFEQNGLTFNSTGTGDNLSFNFTPLENGSRLRVTRRLTAKELIEPIVIQTIYHKIAPVARWEIFGDSQVAMQTAQQEENKTPQTVLPRPRTTGSENTDAEVLRNALSQWIDATNARNIEKQMSFYMPQLKAFYLARNASKNSVRIEKTRAFAAAKSIDIRAEEPEIIFQDGGWTAIMRFRKKYNIQNGSRNQSGEVVQELRWQKTNQSWKIFSERDIRVLR